MKALFITSTRIGDGILSTGLLGHLIDTWPGIRLTIACGPAAAPLFQEVPGLDRLLVMEKRPASGHWFDLWRHVAGTKWDIVVDLRRSAIAWLLRARERRVVPKSAAPIQRVRLLGQVFDLNPPPSPRLWTGAAHEARAQALIPAGPPVLLIAPTANWAGKIWRAERFAELAARLTAPTGILPGARIAVTGGMGEKALAAPMLEAVPAGRRLDVVGVDLLTSHALFKRCALFVGNDSGLMHLAAAAGIPTLGLFGPSADEHYAPWGAHAAAVRTPESFAELTGGPDYDHRTTGTLMDGLGVDTVERAAIDLWARREAGAGAA